MFCGPLLVTARILISQTYTAYRFDANQTRWAVGKTVSSLAIHAFLASVTSTLPLHQLILANCSPDTFVEHILSA